MTDITLLPTRPQDRLAELEGEVIALERAIEYLADRERAHLAVLGRLNDALLGRDGLGGEIHRMLYPDSLTEENGFVHSNVLAPPCPFVPPQRRWSVYGSRAALVSLVERLGVTVVGRRPTREDLVRALWDVGYSHADILAMVAEGGVA